MPAEASPWIIRFQPRPAASLRLFAFPYAGGGASAFRTWPNYLPAGVEVCAVQLPGRESRLKEPPHTRLDALVDALCYELRPWLDRPFALFGHSMGALVAYELTRALRDLSPPLQPVRLFVSGRIAPQTPRMADSLHTLPDSEFTRAVVARYNGIPQVILDTPELLEYFIPVLRADFAMLESYAHASTPRLSCPISVFGGKDDNRVPVQALQGWQDLTGATYDVHLFPGAHFFVNTARDLVLDRIHATLRPCLDGLEASQASRA